MSSNVPQGPVVTPELLQGLIERSEFHLFQGTTTMTCALTLVNGATVVGCAQRAPTTQFSLQAGMDHARADALNQLSQLAGILVWDVINGNVVAAHVGAAVNKLKELNNG